MVTEVGQPGSKAGAGRRRKELFRAFVCDVCDFAGEQKMRRRWIDDDAEQQTRKKNSSRTILGWRGRGRLGDVGVAEGVVVVMGEKRFGIKNV